MISTKEAMYKTAAKMRGVFTAEEFAHQMKREYPRLSISTMQAGVRLPRLPYIQKVGPIPSMTSYGHPRKAAGYYFKEGRK